LGSCIACLRVDPDGRIGIRITYRFEAVGTGARFVTVGQSGES
jgi:hypothetical protein